MVDERPETIYPAPGEDMRVDLVDHSTHSRFGLIRARISLGDEGDEEATDVSWCRMEPGSTLPPHLHPAPFVEIYAQGSYQVGDRQFQPGEARIVAAGVVDRGVAGPDGCTMITVFPTRKGHTATWVEEKS